MNHPDSYIVVFLDGTLEPKGIEFASKIDPGCTLFTTESNYVASSKGSI